MRTAPNAGGRGRVRHRFIGEMTDALVRKSPALVSGRKRQDALGKWVYPLGEIKPRRSEMGVYNDDDSTLY